MQSLLTDLRGDASEPQPDGYLLTVRCPCGVEFMRWMTPGEAARAGAVDAVELRELNAGRRGPQLRARWVRDGDSRLS
jgi:hypothetical protein